MLTRELAVARYDYRTGALYPDRLTSGTDREYLGYAERMLGIYRSGTGCTRGELHRAVRDVLRRAADCPSRRMQAFCKLLDDASTYERLPAARAAALRGQVFRLAADRHPLVADGDAPIGSPAADVKREIGRQLGRPWAEIEAAMFADVQEFHRLAAFRGFADAAALLSRYNVAQVQAALFDARTITVWAKEDFKTILRYAKLAGLMHTVHRAGEGVYRIRFDGPASLLRGTRRYGVAMAKFFPALVACRGWRMHAIIKTRRRGWELSLDVSAQDGLKSHLPSPAEFDSAVEARFARDWGTGVREGWRLEREGEILFAGQKAFFPDFVFRHEDGPVVLLEIVGFWTPDYLRAKAETVRLFARAPLLLAVQARLQEKLPPLTVPLITYKSSLRVDDVLRRLVRWPPIK